MSSPTVRPDPPGLRSWGGDLVRDGNAEVGLLVRHEEDSSITVRFTVANLTDKPNVYQAHVIQSIGLAGDFTDLNWQATWDRPVVPGPNGSESCCPLKPGEWASTELLRLGPDTERVPGPVMKQCRINAIPASLGWNHCYKFGDDYRTPARATTGRVLLKVGLWDESGNHNAFRTVVVNLHGRCTSETYPTCWFAEDQQSPESVWASWGSGDRETSLT